MSSKVITLASGMLAIANSSLTVQASGVQGRVRDQHSFYFHRATELRVRQVGNLLTGVTILN